MKLKTIRRVCLMATAIASAIVFLNVANAVQWREFPQQFSGYNYTNGYTEVFRQQGSTDFDGGTVGITFPLAPPGSYVLRNNQGVVQIKSYDVVQDIYSYSQTCVTDQRSTAPCSMADVYQFYPGSFKFRHTFIWAQASIVCNNYTIDGELVVGTISDPSTDTIDAYSSVTDQSCADGSLPVWGEGEFWHGIV